MMLRAIVGFVAGLTAVTGAFAADRGWENPVFSTAEEAVEAARRETLRVTPSSSVAHRFFVDLTLADGDVDAGHPSSGITRNVVEGILVTHPSAFLVDTAQRRTVERFLAEIPRQSAVLGRRLVRFGYPVLPGMVYLRLVESVDAFSGLNRSSSDRMSRVGGVTYYCRYVVLPLSYVSREGLDELRRSGSLNPSTDIEGTIRQWQNESFANLVNTFRHEMVHVHTNAALGVPRYSNRSAYPTWFHEGTATYLAADPHAGLSAGYQEFQELFFYLVRRFGVAKLQRFYGDVLGESDVGTALTEIYDIADSQQLFVQSGRWHRTTERVKTALWIVGLAVLIAAFKGVDGPYIGVLQLVGAIALGLALVTGLAEYLYGLRGPGVVTAAKTGFGLAVVVLGTLGLRRILRFRNASTA
jgi:hypothetical protein